MAGLLGGATPTGAPATPQEEAEQLTKVIHVPDVSNVIKAT